MTSNKTMRNYAIMGAIGVGALAVILLALGSMQAPKVNLAQNTPGAVGAGPTEGAGQDKPGPGDGGGKADTNPKPIPDITPSASVAVSPNPASPGDQVEVSGSGFGGNQQITITANNDVLKTQPPTVTTSSAGDFKVKATLPENQTGGELNITAADGSNKAATTIINVAKQ